MTPGNSDEDVGEAKILENDQTPTSRGKWSARRHWITWTGILAGLVAAFIALTGIPLNVFWPAPTIPEANVIDVKKPRVPYSSAPWSGPYPGASSDDAKPGWIGMSMQLSLGYLSPSTSEVIDPDATYLNLDIGINEKPIVTKNVNTGQTIEITHAFKDAHEGGSYTYGPITVKILKFWKPPYPWYETPWGPYATDYYQVTFDESKIAWPADPASWPESRTD